MSAPADMRRNGALKSCTSCAFTEQVLGAQVNITRTRPLCFGTRLALVFLQKSRSRLAEDL